MGNAVAACQSVWAGGTACLLAASVSGISCSSVLLSSAGIKPATSWLLIEGGYWTCGVAAAPLLNHKKQRYPCLLVCVTCLVFPT